MGKSKKKSNNLTVAEIIVQNLIEKIEREQKLPWQKPFIETCSNWFTEKEYLGINRLLLEGSEWITYLQLQEYNKKNKTSYYIPPGSESSYCVFYTKYDKKISDEDAESIRVGLVPTKYLFTKITEKEDGMYYESSCLHYYRVFNITSVIDDKGQPLPSRIKACDFTKHHEAEKIVSKYCELSGCRVHNDSGDGNYYSERRDTVFTVPQEHFTSSQLYYRTLFHELGHSTGIKRRLNRDCFKKYFRKTGERSKEELVAEMTSLLLASQCGFTEVAEIENSDNYILSWIKYLKNNPNEVVRGMLAAEKAVDYILNIEQKVEKELVPASTDCEV